jgi:hypothetical protein
MSAEAWSKQALFFHQGLPRGTCHRAPRRRTHRSAPPHLLAWSTSDVCWLEEIAGGQRRPHDDVQRAAIMGLLLCTCGILR